MTNLGDKVNPHISYDKMNGVTVLIPLTKNQKIIVWSLAALFAAYSLFGFFAVPLVVDHLLFTAIAASRDDLRQLAYQRAKLAKDRHLAGGDVDPSRLFVVEPEIAAQGAKGEKRVKFSFK